MTRVAWAVCVVCLARFVCVASSANAQSASSEFWRGVQEPGFARSQTLLRHALRFMNEASQATSQPYRRAALLQSAIARLDRAVAAAPTNPQARLMRATALALYERPSVDGGPTERRVDEAIEAFLRVRELDGTYLAGTVARHLGDLYSRKQAHEEAIREYLYSLEHAFDTSKTSTTHSNLAEVYMLNQQLGDAITHYEEAARIARIGRADPLALPLALWGSAAAHDRIGEHRVALERAAEALAAGGGNMDVLSSENVYFEPPSEIHFYQGLGHMAAAAEAPEPRRRRAALRQARYSWRSYLRLCGDDDPWRELAEHHEREISAQLP